MLRLRGHHILCLHGYRGLGYSPEFVANMWVVRDRLRDSPNLRVKVLDSPDDICAACPHLADGRCRRKDDESEPRVREKDRSILQRLSLAPGDVLPAGKLFDLAAGTFSDGLDEVCSTCRWFPLGWCAAGLRSRVMCGEPGGCPDEPGSRTAGKPR
jgi:hypothetical protein